MLNNYLAGARWPVLWKSIKRLFSYFKGIDEGVEFSFPDGISIADYDIVQSFFISCFHLKDWIKKDCQPEIDNKVEKYVATTKLNECRAVANGLKHLNRLGPDISGIKEIYEINGKERPKRLVKFIIKSEDIQEDAFILAKECLDLWLKFIIENIDPGATLDLER
jgi:hypothetical protein